MSAERNTLAVSWVTELFRYYPDPPNALLRHLQTDDLSQTGLIVTLSHGSLQDFVDTISLIQRLVREAKSRKQAPASPRIVPRRV